jgi:acetone carboxylase gamma subunit
MSPPRACRDISSHWKVVIVPEQEPPWQDEKEIYSASLAGDRQWQALWHFIYPLKRRKLDLNSSARQRMVKQDNGSNAVSERTDRTA